MSGVRVGPAVLPVGGECRATWAARVAEGQPMVLTLDGEPWCVVVDVGSWAEVEEALCASAPAD